MNLNFSDLKPFFFTLLIAASLFTLAGCSANSEIEWVWDGKSCACTGKYNGEVVYEQAIQVELGEKCSDYKNFISIPVIGVSVQLKCTPVETPADQQQPPYVLF